MIVRLTGVLFEKSPVAAILDVQGVGYQVLVSPATYDRLPACGDVCSLLIYHYIREDGQTLFGFLRPVEKRMFELLIAVSGIGPKSAMGVLSGLTADELSSAIAAGDIRRISSAPGIGKKTAERIVLELRDKIDPFADVRSPAEGETPAGVVLRDTVSALAALGFTREQAQKMAQSARDNLPDVTDVNALLKAALGRR